MISRVQDFTYFLQYSYNICGFPYMRLLWNMSKTPREPCKLCMTTNIAFKEWKRFEQINAQKIDEAQIQFEKWWLCLIYSEEGEFMLLKFNLSFFVPGSRFLWIMELAHFASVLSRLASGQFQIKANAKNISFLWKFGILLCVGFASNPSHVRKVEDVNFVKI